MGLVEKNVFILPKIPITNSSLQEVVYYIQYIIYSLSFLNIYNRPMIQIEYNQEKMCLKNNIWTLYIVSSKFVERTMINTISVQCGKIILRIHNVINT